MTLRNNRVTYNKLNNVYRRLNNCGYRIVETRLQVQLNGDTEPVHVSRITKTDPRGTKESIYFLNHNTCELKLITVYKTHRFSYFIFERDVLNQTISQQNIWYCAEGWLRVS